MIGANLELTFRNQRACMQGAILVKIIEHSEHKGKERESIPEANKRTKKPVYVRSNVRPRADTRPYRIQETETKWNGNCKKILPGILPS